MNRDEVTHAAILAAHRQVTLAQIAAEAGPVLVLHDATELDYTGHHSLDEDLGQIGNGHHRGYIAQNSLAVEPEQRRIIGLCDQVLHHRVNVKKNEKIAEKRARETRESRLWLKGTEHLPSDWKLVDVCDQGADTFEFLEHEVQSGRRFVIRAAHDRGTFIGHDSAENCESSLLRTYARGLEPAGHWSLHVTSKVEVKKPKRKGKKLKVKRTKREAGLAVSFAPVQIKAPANKNGEHGNDSLPMWVVRVWEVAPPEGQERLEWFLLTNEPVETFEDAYRVVGWYECRWIIEEYHKGLKTGCKIESPQFTREARLQPAIALISVVALTLLRLRDASRQPDAKTRLATEIIDADYVEVLSLWRHRQARLDWTIHEFYYALARLGGHQNRKSDHPPGWQVLWGGWTDLQLMLIGADAAKESQKM